jgi:hypothetical protein
METCGVFFVEETECLNPILICFGFKTLNQAEIYGNIRHHLQVLKIHYVVTEITEKLQITATEYPMYALGKFV